VDYGSVPCIITFPNGTTTISLDVPINDDDIYEDDEDFQLTINQNTLPNGITIGDTGSATVTIEDNEGEHFDFSKK